MDNNLIKVFEIEVNTELWSKNNFDEKSEWEEILENNNIPYQTEIVLVQGGSSNRPVHAIKKYIYIAEIYENQVQRYKDEYESQVLQEDMDTFGSAEDALLKIRCEICDAEYDIDYPKCPFCK